MCQWANPSGDCWLLLLPSAISSLPHGCSNQLMCHGQPCAHMKIDWGEQQAQKRMSYQKHPIHGFPCPLQFPRPSLWLRGHRPFAQFAAAQSTLCLLTAATSFQMVSASPPYRSLSTTHSRPSADEGWTTAALSAQLPFLATFFILCACPRCAALDKTALGKPIPHSTSRCGIGSFLLRPRLGCLMSMCPRGKQ